VSYSTIWANQISLKAIPAADGVKIKQQEKYMTAHAVTPKLKHPSIIEAVCELRFDETVPYSLIPGAMRERLRGKYSDFEVLPAAALMGAAPDMIPGPIPFHRLKTGDSQFLIQTGPRLLTINALPQYPGFEVFRDHVLEALDHYQDVAEPKNAIRLGLRYINLIQTRAGLTRLNDYFKVNLEFPSITDTAPREANVRLIFSHGHTGQLAVALSYPAQTSTGDAGAALDLDFFKNEPVAFEVSKLSTWLFDAHDRIYTAFRALVTDELMRAMQEGD
jgi:uncharacterized protein (TIGR04255 family)